MEEKLFLFRKHNKKEGQEWDSYFLTTTDNKKSMTAGLTNDAKTEILRSGIEFPLAITIDEDCYFITDDKYEDANGITMYSPRIVLQSFIKIEKADIKKKTLKDVWGE